MAARRFVTSARHPIIRRVLGLAATALTLVLIWIGLDLVRDPEGATRLWSGLYGLIGLDGQASEVRSRGLDPIQAKFTIGALAIVIGVVGIWLLFVGLDRAVELLGSRWSRRLRPYVFVGPAMLMLTVYLVAPTVLTFVASFTGQEGVAGTWGAILGDPDMWIAFRNNLLWLVVGTTGSVVIGLLVASLVDRVKREALAKTFIFLPLAISMVGASVIWGFVYAWVPEGETQIGLANAFWTSLGNAPVPWLQTPPLNTFALILIMVWLQTGFAMVVLSAALKGVPSEIIEAARMDGATEVHLFFRVVVPMIRGSIIAVATTIAIAILKVFDIVYVTTGGRFETEVMANRMFSEMFTYRNFGRASAIAVIIFIAVVPIMVVNIRNLRRQGIGS
ncbi:MAG TPA: sugar ABC transporter permease [Patescibacteria group bacterium]|nr:sugar ABC transporter permease [Patescibacteria group bacterium]